jgi:hypothetical protein
MLIYHIFWRIKRKTLIGIACSFIPELKTQIRIRGNERANGNEIQVLILRASFHVCKDKKHN